MSKMRFETAKLRGRIYEVYGNVEAFAKAMNTRAATISAKLRSESNFTAAEIYKAADLLKIEPYEWSAYFFTPQVEKAQQGGEE